MSTGGENPIMSAAVGRLTARHALGWLVAANLVGVWLAASLVWPALGDALEPFTYGRWMPLHLNWQLYGWCALPLVGALLAWCVDSRHPQATLHVRVALGAWTLALVAGGVAWLGGVTSGKLFLDWFGWARGLLSAAMVVLWTVCAAHACWRRGQPGERLNDGMRRGLLLGLLFVPGLLYWAAGRDVYPAINPDSGGATGASLLGSTLGILTLYGLLPRLLGVGPCHLLGDTLGSATLAGSNTDLVGLSSEGVRCFSPQVCIVFHPQSPMRAEAPHYFQMRQLECYRLLGWWARVKCHLIGDTQQGWPVRMGWRAWGWARAWAWWRAWAWGWALAGSWAVFAAIDRGNASHHALGQILGLGLLLIWVPLAWLYFRRFAWAAAARPWLAAAFGWWLLLVATGFLTFLPGISERLKFTNALVGHAHLAMAGFVTSMNFVILRQLAPRTGPRGNFAAWQAACAIMVVALLSLGWSEAGSHGTGALFRGEGASQLGYAVRLAAGLVMSVASVRWWWQEKGS